MIGTCMISKGRSPQKHESPVTVPFERIGNRRFLLTPNFNHQISSTWQITVAKNERHQPISTDPKQLSHFTPFQAIEFDRVYYFWANIGYEA
ncbi:MAG: hypothetical protein F6K35_52175 [Okeania sp. SIO2H7]|nr:hypothetical protein [Okeania sp. SIO2H7]